MIACCLFETFESWPEVLAQLHGFSERIESPWEGLIFLELGELEARQAAEGFRVAVGLGRGQEAAHLLAFSAQPGNVALYEQAMNAMRCPFRR